MWLTELRDDVASRGPIAARIGAAPNGRLYPKRLRQGEDIGTGAMTFQVISRPFNEYSHDGDSGLRSPRVQWSSWGKTSDDAWTLAEALTAEYSGVTLALATAEFSCATIVGELEDWDAETGLSRVIVDMLLRQKE